MFTINYTWPYILVLTELCFHEQVPKCTLQSGMQTWLAKIDDGSTDKFTRSLLKAILLVAEHMLQDKQLLYTATSMFSYKNMELLILVAFYVQI